jgi:hypothetical protein
MATKYIDFLVTGDPVAARVTAEQALVARKYVLTWQDDWTATAEVGSKTASILVGAFSQYMKVGVRLMSAGPGETTVRIERQSSGWTGGAIGASRTTKNFAALRRELQAIFSGAGVLRSVSEG